MLYVEHNSYYEFDTIVESDAQGVINIEPIFAGTTGHNRPDSYEWPILSAENRGPIDHLNEVTLCPLF